MAENKRVHIKTYGCQMNVYDSERIKDVLAPLGYETTDTPDEADLVVLNTCHIREKAAEKVYSELGRLRPLKEAKASGGGEMLVAVAGCVAQAEGAEMKRRAPMVDMVMGPQTYHQLPEMIAKLHRKSGEALAADFAVEEKFDALPKARSVNGPSAFLTIQEGCDKFCTFCVVPYTRGGEYSRPVDQIAAEARELAARGVREVTLLGQNVNAYHGEPPAGREEDGDWGLGQLARHIAKIGGIERIRYTTSHPRDMDDALINAHAEEEKLMPYLHLPLQAGSDKILKAMNRGHTLDSYLTLIEKIRAARPDIAMSSDFIVGFPGESADDFEMTMEAVREVNYAQCFSFKYSRRPGTPGASMMKQVAEDEKSDRLARLQALLESQQVDFNASCVGRELPVLFEKPGRNEGQLQGRSPYLQAVHVQGSQDLIGQIAPVRIESSSRNSLAGALVREGAAAA